MAWLILFLVVFVLIAVVGMFLLAGVPSSQSAPNGAFAGLFLAAAGVALVVTAFSFGFVSLVGVVI